MVRIRMSPSGKVYEVDIDRWGYGYRKEKGFRTYEAAKKFAEKLALQHSMELLDDIGPPPPPELDESSLTAEEKLLNAIWGYWGDRGIRKSELEKDT